MFNFGCSSVSRCCLCVTNSSPPRTRLKGKVCLHTCQLLCVEVYPVGLPMQPTPRRTQHPTSESLATRRKLVKLHARVCVCVHCRLVTRRYAPMGVGLRRPWDVHSTEPNKGGYEGHGAAHTATGSRAPSSFDGPPRTVKPDCASLVWTPDLETSFKRT